MRRSDRLQVVLDLEKRREEAALNEMQQARAALDAEEKRRDDLQRYLSEYQHQMRQGASGTVHASRLQAMHGFVAQLDQAIRQQQQRIDAANRQFQLKREQWQQAWERREGMDRFIRECRLQEQRADDRREQKEIDEAANLRFAHRQNRSPRR